MLFKKQKIRTYFFINILFALIIACDKEKDYVPYVPIYYSIDIINQLNLGENESATITYFDDFTSIIQYPGNPSRPEHIIPYATKGNGVLIYKSFETYLVYDLTCTYKPQENYCATEYDPETSIHYVCPCCGSKFNLLLDAFPEGESPASRPLKSYNTLVDGMQLIISN